MSARTLSIVLAAVLALVPVTTTRAAQPPPATPGRDGRGQPTVLLLAIDDFTRPYMRLLFEGFTDAISATANLPAIYFETIDASRFQDREYAESLRGWLRGKYKDRHIDLIVPIGEDAVGFLAAAHGEPWPAAQVLFFESGGISLDTRSTLPQAGGILLEDHFATAIGVVRSVLPDIRRVALLYGASAIERARWGGFAGKVRTAGLEPIELVATSMDDTRAAVARLPADTVILVLAPIVDAKGTVLSPVRVCETIAALGIAPTLTLEANNLGCGAVGGALRDWTVIGRLIGAEALARLSRPSTDIVTVPASHFTTLAFDDRQLQRWSIPEQRLPSGAVVRFRDASLWRDRRPLVLTTIGVTVLQSLLIAGLVFERRRRRKAEVESRRNLTALAHLDRRGAMGELTTSLAHELNQPLNAILQNAGVAQMLLAATPVPQGLDEMSDIISDIRKDDIRASEIIRRMRLLLQKHEPESHPVDLNEVAHETVALVRSEMRSREIELETDLEDGIRPILGDRVHLQQVLLNLLMNAMDAVAAMPPGRRQVRVRTRQDGPAVRLAVTDTGAGIPTDRIARVFEPFFTTKSEGSGMGMGLAIARSIMDAHRGRIAAENNANGGATVWFSLPISATSDRPGQ